MKEQDRTILRKLIDGRVDRSARILDFGCGRGNNISYLKKLGYLNVTGVDVSDRMVDAARKTGHEAYGISEFSGLEGSFDLVLFSHVLEHIEYKDLRETMEACFGRLRRGGYAVVLSPVLYDAFFADVDHIKPYLPAGLSNLFSDRDISRSYGSDYRLELLDIHFRRESLLPHNLRSRYMRDLKSRMIFNACRVFFGLARALSFGLIGKTTGYGAIYRVSTDGGGHEGKH